MDSSELAFKLAGAGAVRQGLSVVTAHIVPRR